MESLITKKRRPANAIEHPLDKNRRSDGSEIARVISHDLNCISPSSLQKKRQHGGDEVTPPVKSTHTTSDIAADDDVILRLIQQVKEGTEADASHSPLTRLVVALNQKVIRLERQASLLRTKNMKLKSDLASVTGHSRRFLMRIDEIFGVEVESDLPDSESSSLHPNSEYSSAPLDPSPVEDVIESMVPAPDRSRVVLEVEPHLWTRKIPLPASPLRPSPYVALQETQTTGTASAAWWEVESAPSPYESHSR